MDVMLKHGLSLCKNPHSRLNVLHQKNPGFSERKGLAAAFIVFSLLVLHNSEKQPCTLIILLVSYRKLESTGWLRSSKPWL